MKDDEEFIFIDDPSKKAPAKAVKKESAAPVSASINEPAPSTKNTENEKNDNFIFLDPLAQEDSGAMSNDSAIGAGVGLAASEAFRLGMPEGAPYSKEVRAAKQLQLEEGKENVKSAVEAAKRMLPEDFEAHQQRGLDLKTQLDVLRALHDQQEEAHRKAALTHEYHKTLNINEYLPPELRINETPASGGEKWGKNWAGQDRPGTSVPEAAAAYQRSKGRGPVTSRLTKLWGPSQVQEPGTPAISQMDRLAANRLAQEQQQALAEERAKATPQAEQKLAEARAKAKIELENTKKARDASHRQLMEIERAFEAYRNTAAPTTPRIDESTVKQQTKNEANEKALANRYGGNPLTKIMSRFPGAESRVATPVTSGALAPYWAEKAQEAWDKQPNWRAALTDPDVLTYGAGTAGALAAMLPHPYVRGAGVALQAPAVYFSGKETLNGPLSEAAKAAIFENKP